MDLQEIAEAVEADVAERVVGLSPYPCSLCGTLIASDRQFCDACLNEHDPYRLMPEQRREIRDQYRLKRWNEASA